MRELPSTASSRPERGRSRGHEPTVLPRLKCVAVFAACVLLPGCTETHRPSTPESRAGFIALARWRATRWLSVHLLFGNSCMTGSWMCPTSGSARSRSRKPALGLLPASEDGLGPGTPDGRALADGR